MTREEFLKILGLGVVAFSVPILPDKPKTEDEPDIYHVKAIFKRQGGDRYSFVRFKGGKDIRVADKMITDMESDPNKFGKILSMTTSNGRYFTTR